MFPFSVILMVLVAPKILTLIRVDILFHSILKKKAPEIWVQFGVALNIVSRTLSLEISISTPHPHGFPNFIKNPFISSIAQVWCLELS